ncbi:MAG TPA: DUF1775 domain-containing protein [Kribbella sp.]
MARAAAILIGGVLLFSGIPAFAHVHVHADKEVRPGSTNVRLTFHVPNEKASAHTIAVRVRLAAGLSGVRAENSGAWTAAPEPRAQGNSSAVTSAVTWTGGSIGGGDGVDFVVHVDKLPTGVAQLSFTIDQTYDDGEVVNWSEATTEGAPEPEHPAPVLVLDSSQLPASATGAAAAGSGGAAKTAAIVSAAVAVPALLVLVVVGRLRARNRRQPVSVGRE